MHSFRAKEREPSTGEPLSYKAETSSYLLEEKGSAPRGWKGNSTIQGRGGRAIHKKPRSGASDPWPNKGLRPQRGEISSCRKEVR